MRAFIWKIENPVGWPALESGAALARFTCAPVTRCQPFRCTVARISSRNGAQQMSYTLGQAAKAVGMAKPSILRSIKAGRISAGRNEFGQWAIEPCELHRVYPALTDESGTGNGTGERAVTGGETAVAQANARAALAEARLSDSKTMLEDIREQRDRWRRRPGSAIRRTRSRGASRARDRD